jgi:hypothetical protein
MRTAKKRLPEYSILDRQVLAVALEGAIGDWAAYIGSVQGDNFDEEWQKVAANGTKLRQEIAELMFPNWKTLDWRD